MRPSRERKRKRKKSLSTLYFTLRLWFRLSFQINVLMQSYTFLQAISSFAYAFLFFYLTTEKTSISSSILQKSLNASTFSFPFFWPKFSPSCITSLSLETLSFRSEDWWTKGRPTTLARTEKSTFWTKIWNFFVKHFARATLSHLSLMVVIWASHEVTRSRGLWLQPHFFDLNFNILSAPFSFNILPKTEMNSYRSFSGFSTLLEVCIISSIPSNGKKTLIVFFFRFKTVWNVSKTLLLIVSCQFPFNLTLVMTFWFISSEKESGQMLC